MNQAEVSKLVSKLRIKIRPTHRRFKTPQGPPGRLDRMRKCVTALIKYERIELNYPSSDESRGYAERLISDAIRHGDQDAQTMEMANFWITEKQYIHKLFKVLVPRYQNCPLSYTRMYKAPNVFPTGHTRTRSVLELRWNPFPPLKPDMTNNRNFIHNVLLEEAKKVYRRQKYAQLIGENAEAKNVDKIAEELEKVEICDSNEKESDKKESDEKKSDEKSPENETKKE